MGYQVTTKPLNNVLSLGLDLIKATQNIIYPPVIVIQLNYKRNILMFSYY